MTQPETTNIWDGSPFSNARQGRHMSEEGKLPFHVPWHGYLAGAWGKEKGTAG